MYWIAGLTLMLSAILFVLLVAPVRVVCLWAGGVMNVDLRMLGLTLRLWGTGKAPDPACRPSASVALERLEKLWLHRSRLEATRVHTWRLAKGIWKSCQLERGEVEIHASFGDPALTGASFGTLSALAGICQQRWPRLRLKVTPRFDTPCWEANGELVFRVRQWETAWYSLRYLGSLFWLDLWRWKQKLAYLR